VADAVDASDPLEDELEALLATARAQQSLIRTSLITLTEYLHRPLPG
jgi:hypothetical protein